MKVLFRPSYDEHVAHLTVRQRQESSEVSQMASWVLFAFNLGFVPALLVFRDLYLMAAGVFVVNAVIVIFLLSWQQKKNLRSYYERVWPELENHDCEIELSENGVLCRHAGNHTFFPWKNIKKIIQDDSMITFDAGHTALLVSKRGFDDKESSDAFLAEAKRLAEAAKVA